MGFCAAISHILRTFPGVAGIFWIAHELFQLEYQWERYVGFPGPGQLSRTVCRPEFLEFARRDVVIHSDQYADISPAGTGVSVAGQSSYSGAVALSYSVLRSLCSPGISCCPHLELA